MKLFLFLILLFTPYFVFCQNDNTPQKTNYLFDYTIIYNTSRHIERAGVLIINDTSTKSIFHEKKDKKRKRITKKEGKRIITLSNKKTRFNFFDYNRDSLISKEDILNEGFNVKEKIPVFNWKLLDTTKVINNISVKCATTNLRGRKYIAWYSTKYPVKSGPWKFNGLPGLIVDVYDETKRYRWTLSKIYSEKINFEKYISKIINNDLPNIQLKEFVNLKYSNNRKIISRLQSKLPRGARASFTRAKRSDKELQFEWEKTATKK
ncbi:GLPGLI family protein [uncultured Tenacibaculum sp.]|uniref:GLPGLI family protein n=1 Tax=uncultured Tenacibaculum sp. TaxID=174713 RepID=UPI00261627A4|nr:GLPGLI family protein [uncultured Tenacibaculum sp.]